MKACILFTSDNEMAEEWRGKFYSREPLDIYGQKYLIDEISTDYEPGFAGVTIKMYPVYQAKSPERPKKQEAWDGEGLPPVNCFCETLDEDADCWVKVEIYAHTEFMGETHACAKNGTDMFFGLANEFRPIKTAEQLAEEERKSQLELMHKIYMEGASEHKGGLAALYDAGYKLAK